ncbi:hypothetical protein TYRP_002458 [Tyrophagus putrescentiae]|nr:hypothetical protein TYRP_002458 [Tyrophagus putrescentiae]
MTAIKTNYTVYRDEVVLDLIGWRSNWSVWIWLRRILILILIRLLVLVASRILIGEAIVDVISAALAKLKAELAQRDVAGHLRLWRTKSRIERDLLRRGSWSLVVLRLDEEARITVGEI